MMRLFGKVLVAGLCIFIEMKAEARGMFNNEEKDPFFAEFEAGRRSFPRLQDLERRTSQDPFVVDVNFQTPQDLSSITSRFKLDSFNQREYDKALDELRRVREGAKQLPDPSLFLSILCLESLMCRICAGNQVNEIIQQRFYSRALNAAEEAESVYEEKRLDNPLLQGRISLLVGSAHGDNPKGDLDKAVFYYSKALDCFSSAGSKSDLVLAKLRLAKSSFLQKKFDLTQQLIDEIRSLSTSQIVAMQIDYLEAQLKLMAQDFTGAENLARSGLAIAGTLKSAQNEALFNKLLEQINNNVNSP